MADLRTSFAVLEDSSTQAGLPLHKVLEGDAIAAKNASAGLVAKDGSSNFAYLNVNASGELIVNNGAESIACLDANGSHAGSTSLLEITGASIDLTTNAVYKNIALSVSSFRSAYFDIIWDDDGSETILASVRVGAGQYSYCCKLDCSKFTAGATEVTGQKLLIKGKNLVVASTMDASIQVEEVQ